MTVLATRQHWLDAQRLRVYPWIFLGLFLLAAAIYPFTFRAGVDPTGHPAGSDFVTFWSAAVLALHGQAASVYDVAQLAVVEQAGVPGLAAPFGWFYPPTFLLIVLPLGLLPYLGALAVFLSASLAVYLAVARRVVPREGLVLLVAFPGLWICLIQGQNGLLTAALAGAAVILLERRPAWAGVLIGLLAIKPHLAVLFPVLLLARGAWRAFGVAACTAVAFLGVSLLVGGPGLLGGWWTAMDAARGWVETGALPRDKMPSVFAAGLQVGLSPAGAYVVQGVAALAAVVAVWVAGRRARTPAAAGAVLVVGTFLANPYVFDYDLAWLVFPIAWLALDGLRRGWLPWDREVLVAAWLLPLVVSPLARFGHVPIGPVVIALLAWVALRRVLTSTWVVDPIGAEV